MSHRISQTLIIEGISDRLFDGIAPTARAAFGRFLYSSIVTLLAEQVLSPSSAVPQVKQKTRRSLPKAGPEVLEMRRLELLTPYMRSKCSTS
jgi:hypothetical protein